MTEELRRRKDEEHKILEVFDRELDSMEKNQIEMKNKITEMKNKLKGINSRRTKTECISDLETK